MSDPPSPTLARPPTEPARGREREPTRGAAVRRAARQLGRPRAAAAGFTLLELIVTLAIIAIVTALAAPAIAGRLIESPTTRSARLLKALLEEARGSAATTGETAAVVWQPEAHRFVLRRPGRDHAFIIPRDVDVSVEGLALGPARDGRSTEAEKGVLFTPLGGSTGGSVVISSPGRRVPLRVDPLTGYISFEEGP